MLNNIQNIKNGHRGTKIISVLKVARGTAALCVGLFLLKLRNTLANPMYEIEKMHTEDQDPILKMLLNKLNQDDMQALTAITITVLSIATLRYVEAIGLWLSWRWAQWLAFITSLIYIPFEIISLYREYRIFVMVILVVNILICIYLFRVIKLKNLGS